jgi:LysM repeat protein
MSKKSFAQLSVLVLILAALLATPRSAQAGGVCGGTYVVEWGDTLGKIAAMCGTTVSAIYAANPGLGDTLYAGQILKLPGSGGNPCNCPAGYTGTYVVQYGDTFSGIALLHGVSVKALWAANPRIWNINLLYPGQVIRIPGSSGVSIVTVSTESASPLSYGTAPSGTPKGKVKLANKSKTEVYVSLQGTTRDGTHVINEYPVGGTMEVKVASGWYTYVAWVGGRKYEGQFRLSPGGDVSITFYRDKVVHE